MTLLAYIALALVAGSVLGTALGFMMNAEKNQVLESRRSLALVGTAVAERRLGNEHPQPSWRRTGPAGQLGCGNQPLAVAGVSGRSRRLPQGAAACARPVPGVCIAPCAAIPHCG